MKRFPKVPDYNSLNGSQNQTWIRDSGIFDNLSRNCGRIWRKTGSWVKTIWFLSNKSRTVIMLHRNHTENDPLYFLNTMGSFPTGILKSKNLIWPKMTKFLLLKDFHKHTEVKLLIKKSFGGHLFLTAKTATMAGKFEKTCSIKIQTIHVMFKILFILEHGHSKT